MAEKKKLDIDKALDELESINRKLEEKDISLQESLKLYQEGTALAEACKKELAGVEKELIILNEGKNA